MSREFVVQWDIQARTAMCVAWPGQELARTRLEIFTAPLRPCECVREVATED